MPKPKKTAAKPAAKPAVKPAEKPAAAAVPRQPTILMVDDDAFMAGMYETRLTAHGFNVVNAYDGEEGLKKAKQILPDLIMLDVVMPKLDGFETLKRLKQDPALSSIPVVMLTSMGQKEDIDLALSQGAVDYLLKTQTLPSDALDKIRKILAKK